MREPIALRPESPTVERGHYHSAPLHRCKLNSLGLHSVGFWRCFA